VFSGGHADEDDKRSESEFWYDPFDAYKYLVLNHNYTHENIFFIYGDGNDFTTSKYTEYRPSTYGWSDIVDYSNKSIDDIEDAFESIADEITDDDNLLIWWSSHGAPDPDPHDPEEDIICLDCYHVSIFDQNQSKLFEIDDEELIEIVNLVDNYKRRKIIWETCYSGCLVVGDVNLNNDRTVMITATEFNQTSGYYYGTGEGHQKYHTDFNYVINRALLGEDPFTGESYNADHDWDGVISMYDLYQEVEEDENTEPWRPQLLDDSNLAEKTFVNENLILEDNVFDVDYNYWVETISINSLTISNSSHITFEIDESFEIKDNFACPPTNTFDVIIIP
jgi:hypothetical protein